MTQVACRSCGRAVIWTQTIHGKKMPVDAEPVAIGNIYLEEWGAVPIAHVASPAELAKHDLRYVSHFARCRDSQSWRKSR